MSDTRKETNMNGKTLGFALCAIAGVVLLPITGLFALCAAVVFDTEPIALLHGGKHRKGT